MDLWKSPKQFVSEMMDSIELHVIRLPATQWIELPDSASGSTTITGSSNRASSETIRSPSLLKSWWNTRVSPIIAQDADVRDHYGKGIFPAFSLSCNPPGAIFGDIPSPDSFIALERTFLAHFHTSVALVEVSVYISQWYTLSPISEPDSPVQPGLIAIGKPLSCALVIWAIAVMVIGATRFFRMQDCMLKGSKISAGGWDLKLEGLGILVVS